MVKPNVRSFDSVSLRTAINRQFIAAVTVEGEMLSLTKITRSEMGAYLCIGEDELKLRLLIEVENRKDFRLETVCDLCEILRKIQKK
jgi:hypothetical protein